MKLMTSSWQTVFCGAALASMALAGCGGGTSTETGSGGAMTGNASSNAGAIGTASTRGLKLTGAGATFPYPIYSKWFDSYNQKTGTQINYQSIGSGAGIKQLKSETVDFGASDVALSDKDLKEMPHEVAQIPTVAGAVAIVYNLPQAKGKIKLSGPVLADIYLGVIKKWNDAKIAALNAGNALPDTGITVAHRSDGSGTSNIFTSYLKAVSPQWATKVGAGKSVAWPTGVGGKGNDGVASVVKSTKGGIGYVELAYAEQNKMSYAAMQNASGQFVEPTVDATVAAAEGGVAGLQKDIRTPIVNAPGAAAYPIAGYTYILVYKQPKDAAKGKAIAEFLKWAMEDGQASAKDLLYAPLPKEVVALNEKTIAALK